MPTVCFSIVSRNLKFSFRSRSTSETDSRRLLSRGLGSSGSGLLTKQLYRPRKGIPLDEVRSRETGTD